MVNQVANRSRADEDGHFEVIVNARVPRQKMESPTTIKCILTIPDTNYSKKKESIFYGKFFVKPHKVIAVKDQLIPIHVL